jgi:hypothetical protein
MNCCDYDCRQGDDCPARKAATPPAKPVEHDGSASEPVPDVDPIPRMGAGLHVVRWIGLGLMVLVTLVWVAGLAGFLYARHQGV